MSSSADSWDSRPLRTGPYEKPEDWCAREARIVTEIWNEHRENICAFAICAWGNCMAVRLVETPCCALHELVRMANVTDGAS